ncbi:MAG: hypothetical protein OET44_20280 [Gammaproteobacteria bacterium]|nr:hypothetical protein [Gammaproteobacteria bacterium]
MANQALDDKRQKIEKLLAMQRKFIELDHEQGVEMKEYFAPEEGDALQGYRQQYTALAMEVVDEAHAIVGSKRE